MGVLPESVLKILDPGGPTMRIGYAVDLHGWATPPRRTGWDDVRTLTLTAESIGFDLVVVPDHTLYSRETGSVGCWESVATAGALAAVTSTVRLGHSMFNGPYRPPTLVAKAAETLDEITGGRYVLGIGAGNTEDYDAVGVAGDRRYSRFAEAIEIIHRLLKDGAVDLRGEHWRAEKAEMVMRGPRPTGPPVVVAAWGPRMMALAARFADEWNACTPGGFDAERLRSMSRAFDLVCEASGRDPASLTRSADVVLDPLGLAPEGGDLLCGSHREMADGILGVGESAGMDEVRCYLVSDETPDGRRRALDAMAEVVGLVHAA